MSPMGLEGFALCESCSPSLAILAVATPLSTRASLRRVFHRELNEPMDRDRKKVAFAPKVSHLFAAVKQHQENSSQS